MSLQAAKISSVQVEYHELHNLQLHLRNPVEWPVCPDTRKGCNRDIFIATRVPAPILASVHPQKLGVH